MKTLSVVVPCFNSAAYMRHCIDSVLTGGNRVEVIIVNDGSSDDTAAIADDYARRFPHSVRAVHQPNGGHGAAVNAGIRAAVGRYLKVVDSDDWVDINALKHVLDTLDGLLDGGAGPDLLVSNFVYEKEGKKHKRVVRYRNSLPTGRVFHWDEFGRFRNSQYMLMHSLTYRTQLLRDIGLELPSHTFYVDNIYASVPLRYVKTMFYLDVDLYRYFIGRPDQSVNESVMIRRIDQQVRVTNIMRAALPSPDDVHPAQYGYLLHYFRIVNAVTSLMLIRSGTQEDIVRKTMIWETIRAEDPCLHRKMRRSVLGHLVNLPGAAGRRTTLSVYQAARWAIGFN